MKEEITLIFEKDEKIIEHKWVIKKGFRGIRDTKKILKLQKKYGDPINIIGEGSVANLLRKEFKLYNEDRASYEGIKIKDVVIIGAELTGIPVKKIQKFSNKIAKKLQRK